MADPNVNRSDGGVVPLVTWELDGLMDTVASLSAIVDDAVKARPGTRAADVYETFGVRSFPAVLVLVRQLPRLIEELRKHRERGL